MTLFLIFILLYLNFRWLTEMLIVMRPVPLALTGGLWLMYLMGFNMSIAVAVGFIALAGVARDRGRASDERGRNPFASLPNPSWCSRESAAGQRNLLKPIGSRRWTKKKSSSSPDAAALSAQL